MTKTCLGVFAKFWLPGKVKTRLAERIGNEEAADIYRQFLALTLLRCKAIANTRVLAIDRSDCRDKFAELAGPAWQLSLQTPEDNWSATTSSTLDLGERMSHFFRQMFQHGAQRVVLIGSDTPQLVPQAIENALQQLEKHDAVLGPAQDGGYWLIGMRRFLPELFKRVDWSTSQVMTQTTGILEAEDLSYATIEMLSDIDQWNDLVNLQASIRSILENQDLDQSIVSAFRELQRTIESLTCRSTE